MEKKIKEGYTASSVTSDVFTMFRQVDDILFRVSVYAKSEEGKRVDETLGIRKEIEEVQEELTRARDAFLGLIAQLVAYDIIIAENEDS